MPARRRTYSRSRTVAADAAADLQQDVVAAAPEPIPEPAPRAPALDPALGMASAPWGGIPHWRCAKCGESTFHETAALRHRC